ncbi:MAG: gamma carbonic anhydrase family protein [Saccharofermentanales bacterium]|jgi:carbonic anhydrase/acetyltransferase-like protein (isoleucine patch superfamily)|nr:gamma carbonic anhydrase family protein [Clostridiaceae bacterium]
MIYQYNGFFPQIDEEAFVAPGASVVGDVRIGAQSSVWFNAVIRGDNAPVRIGEGTSVQDNACIHDRTTIGNRVTIGHGAVVHACTVDDNALIGMGAVILDGAVVGADSIVAAGSVVRMGTIIPPATLFAGNPAVWKKDLSEEIVALNRQHAEYYAELGSDYRKNCREIIEYADD